MNREMSQEELLTRYMVGRYRLGHETVALYLAGMLFERLINRKIIDKSEITNQDISEDNLGYKIDFLKNNMRSDGLFFHKKLFLNYSGDKFGLNYRAFSEDEKIRKNQIIARLHDFRSLRNNVMHGKFDIVQNYRDGRKDDIINYLWCEFSPNSFENALRKKGDKKRLIDTLKEHTADYMVRDFDEVEAKNKDHEVGSNLELAKIYASDFDNLFILRQRLVPLKNYLGDWLTENADLLQTDILTTIDTTSSYIWMPLVPRKTLADKQRSSVYSCSVSLLATPLDLRVYMDFGGSNREQRKLYYDFLDGSPEYSSFYDNFRSAPSLEVFDVDWYSCMFNKWRISEWLPRRESALSAARKKINAAPKAESSPITWNRCLHGFVFSKFDLGKGHVIDFDMIKQSLLDVIEFYMAFDRYKNRIGKESGRD